MLSVKNFEPVTQSKYIKQQLRQTNGFIRSDSKEIIINN